MKMPNTFGTISYARRAEAEVLIFTIKILFSFPLNYPDFEMLFIYLKIN